MNLKDITIIIPTRNNVDLFTTCIKSVRSNYSEIPIMVYVDDCASDDIAEQYEELSKTYDFSFIRSAKRKGITITVDELIDAVKTDVVYYIHDDMVLAPNSVENLLKNLRERTIVSSTRIEPPLHPEQKKVKITKNFGISHEDFDVDAFNSFSENTAKMYANKTSDGVFAPFMFYKKDWLGHNKLFVPQSKEDSEWQYRMKLLGYNFVQAWDSIVYHFTSRGSRFRDGIGKDSDEWKKSNSKNMKNFIRIFHTTPIYTETQHPIVGKQLPMSSLIIIDKTDDPYVLLDMVEPFFQDIVILLSDPEQVKEVQKYIKDTEKNGPTNFNKDNIQILSRVASLDEDINKALKLCQYDQIFIPSVKALSYPVLNNLRILVNNTDKKTIKIPLFPDNKSAHFIIHKGTEWSNGQPYDNNNVVTNEIYKQGSKDFIRTWGECESHRFGIGRKIAPYKKGDAKYLTLGMSVLHRKESHLIPSILNHFEPYVDEIIIVNDGDDDAKLIDIVDQYISIHQANSSFDIRNKIKIVNNELNQDFAKQRNFADDQLNTDYIIHMDCDEQIEDFKINYIRSLMYDMQEQNIEGVAFPRKNYVDGKQTQAYPDYQGRLYKRGVKWINRYPFDNASPGCHEQIEPMVSRKNFATVDNINIIHIKGSQKQTNQNNFYKNMWRMKNEPSKILYDSVLYTYEGITKHAREEIKEWINDGKDVNCLDLYRENTPFSKELKNAYTSFPVDNDDYVTIINQPPSRWNKSIHYSNAVVFLAMEGKPPSDWVKAMNDPRINQVWTPSSYCKEEFINAGVRTPVKVIPHGIDPNIWKPLSNVNKLPVFTFLVSGAPNGPRKGIDDAIVAFCHAFKPNDPVQMIIKVNKIYDKGMNVNDLIMKYATPEMASKIVYIDTDLTEREMVELMNIVHVYVSPHKSEGFGMHILEAMACGVPVIATGKTGNMEFCNENNTMLIDVEDKLFIPPFRHPYEEAVWYRPKLQHLIDLMRKAKNEYKKISEKYSIEGIKTANKFTWKYTIDCMKRALTGKDKD